MNQSHLDGIKNQDDALKKVARKLIVGINDLKTMFPQIALEAYGWDPSTVSKGSKEKRWWKCSKGHIYQMRVAHRTCVYGKRQKGSGCSKCNKNQKIRVTKENNLKAKLPNVASEIIGADPEAIYFKERKKHFVFQCPNGHFYKSRLWMQHWKLKKKYSHKNTGSSGCPVCSNRLAITGVNDLKTTHPHLAEEAKGWDSTTILFNSHKKLPWKWSCGHQYLVSPAYRIKSGKGAGRPCPGCADGGGYNRSKPGYLYLVCRPGQFQFGVTNKPESRIGYTHKRNGWELVDCASSLFGEEIWEAELRLKRALRAQGIPTGENAFREKFDGWKESFHSVDLQAGSLKELFKRLSLPLPPFLSA